MSLHKSKNVKDTSRLHTQFTVVAAEIPAELNRSNRQQKIKKKSMRNRIIATSHAVNTRNGPM